MRHFRSLAACILALILTLSLAVPASAASGSFTDVPAGHWAAAEIRRSVQVGLIQGETATRFGLGRYMTRGAFASILCRFFQWELVDYQDFFPDVPKDLWCCQAIETALVHGTVTTQADNFRPGDPITREEMAVMLVRALGYGSISGLDLGLSCPFTDVRTNQGYLALAYHLGIINGTSATTFSPDRSATREQAVVMLMRIYDRYYSAAPAKLGFVCDAARKENWTGFTDLILSGGRLSVSGVVTAPKGVDDFLVQCRLQGSQAILGVTADAAALSGDPTLQASRVVSAADGFGGVALTVSGMTAKQRDNLTALVTALRQLLPSQRLLVSVDANGSYDLAALAAQCDGLLDIGGQERIGQLLHDAVEIAGDVVARVDQVDVAARDLLDERHVGRERVLADDEACVVERLVARRRDQLREILRDGVGIALHRLAVMRDHLPAHQRGIEQIQDDGKGDEQQRKEAEEANRHGAAVLDTLRHGSVLSNL